jgi:hypothetical protein
MKSQLRYLFTAILCATAQGLLFDSLAHAQSDLDDDFATSSAPQPNEKEEDDDNIIRKPKDATEIFAKEFSKAERQKACAKFESKIASVSGEMWKIQKCMRHQIQDADNLFRMTRNGLHVVETDSKDLAAIPIGDTWESLQRKEKRSCAQFNGRYITHSYTEIYYVQSCTRYFLPDYESYIQHRRKSKVKAQEILALNDAEFYGLKSGKDLSSVIDAEFATLLDGRAGVEIIPIDEACKGLEGKNTSFYSRIYRIEKCRKREIDAEAFSSKHQGKLRLTEMTPEQWISLPDGTPAKP